FSGSAYLGGTSGDWLATNISPAIVLRGVRTGNAVKHVELFNGTIGGPIKKDKLWFLFGARSMSSSYRVANQPAEVVLPTGQTLGTDSGDRVKDMGLRLTWQAAKNVKVSGYYERYYRAIGSVGANTERHAVTARDPHHS